MNRTSTRATGPAALVVALVALLVALGGTSFAAVTLAKNSVGTKQLKNNAVQTTKVKDGTLLAGDFAPGQLPAATKGETGVAGPQGPAGPKGATGNPGNTGATGAVGVSDYVIVSNAGTINATSDSTVTATCTDGRKVLGGGGGNYAGDIALTFSAPTDSSGQIIGTNPKVAWTINVRNNSSSSRAVFVYAICAKVAS